MMEHAQDSPSPKRAMTIFTVVIILMYLVELMVIALGVNPYVAEGYRRAGIEAPIRIRIAMGLGVIECLIIWLAISLLLIWKDKFMETRFVVNAGFVLLLAVVFVFYPTLVDIIHVPMSP